MPGFDDRLKQHLERLAPPADPSGAFDRVLERKIRHRLVRRFQAAGLAVAVVAATAGGTFALVRAFESRDDSDRLGAVSPTPVRVSNGRIAYASQPPGTSYIMTVDPDGTDEVNVSGDALAPARAPAWAPDGTRIAFVSERDGYPAIYVMDADGSNAVQVKRIDFANHALAWSPDGTQIAYISSGELFVMNADGSRARRITSGAKRLDFSPTWAPDGSRIAFARYTFSEPLSDDPFAGQEPEGSGIYVVNPDGSGVAELAGGPASSDDLFESPDWSPNGRKIVFGRAGDIHVMGSDGSEMRKLTDSEEGNSPSVRPRWSPDGTKIVFERIPAGESSPQIHTMKADGTDLVSTGVAGGQDEILEPDWQPIPAGAPTSSPTAEPSPSTSPFPAECDASQVTGNFDGDGQLDTATVVKSECLRPGSGALFSGTAYSLQVRWPPSEGIAPLPDCRNICKAVAAADLNGDGIDEFILQIHQPAISNVYLVYELPAKEAFGRPSDVAPPGTPEFPTGEPAQLRLGSSSEERYFALGCDLIEHQVIVQIAELNPERTRYNVHEILLRFDPIESPPFGRFTVVSERDFTETHEEGIQPGDQFEPGDPCWIQTSP